MRSKVDLPEPLRPTRQTRSPAETLSSALSSSGVPPKVRAMSASWTSGGAMARVSLPRSGRDGNDGGVERWRRELAGLRTLDERKWNLVLAEDHLVVREQAPQVVSQLIELLVRFGIEPRFSPPARHVSSVAERIKGVALHQYARKTATRMPHHGCIADVGIDLDLLDTHRVRLLVWLLFGVSVGPSLV